MQPALLQISDTLRTFPSLNEARAKPDVSFNSEGYRCIERISFEPYNESTCLVEAVERLRERAGHYPKLARPDADVKTNKSGSIRIIWIESKWSGASAYANAVTA